MKPARLILFVLIIAVIQLLFNFPYGFARKNEITSNIDKIPEYSAHKYTIRDWQYNDGKIFDLGRPEDFQPGDSIANIKVFRSHPYYSPSGDVIMYVNPLNTGNPAYQNENVYVDRYDEIPDSMYSFNATEYIITFNRKNGGSRNNYIGVFMNIKRGDSLITIGDTLSNPIELKLIRHRYLDSTMVSFNYVWRNVYYIWANNPYHDSLEVNIYKGLTHTEATGDNLDHQDGIPYIRILGLDRYNLDGDTLPDGLVDFQTPIVDYDNGILIFPDRHPFDPIFHNSTVLLNPVIPEIYDYKYAHNNAGYASQYYIEVTLYYIID